MRVSHRRTQASSAVRHVGQVRKAQLITTYGCGAIVDFVHDTAVIAGCDHWDNPNTESGERQVIHNENLQCLLRVAFFMEPKTEDEDSLHDQAKSRDVPAYRFPETLYCTQCHRLIRAAMVDQQREGALKCPECGNAPLLPSRFVAVCERGHLEDFPYDAWVHEGAPCEKCSDGYPELMIYSAEGRTSLEYLYVYCRNCKKSRRMQGIFAADALNRIHRCGGHTPWLPYNGGGHCGHPLRVLNRNAVNVYFPANVSALSIPPWSDRIAKALRKHWAALKYIMPERLLSYIESSILPALPGVPLTAVMDKYRQFEQGVLRSGSMSQRNLFEDEYAALTRYTGHDGISDDEFSTAPREVPPRYRPFLERVTAVDRLTETVALIGFTRLKPWSGALDDENLAKLTARPINWRPAVRYSGEGIFIEFSLERIRRWAVDAAPAYQNMMDRLRNSFLVNDRACVEYVLLHTFAHLLIRQLAALCGYNTASLKERVYSTFITERGAADMAGVLIYTASPDADGSLGGLVEQARPENLGRIMDAALKDAAWCPSDPVCAQTCRELGQGVDALNYAACHNCALLPEPSCEMRNLLLDRGALIHLVGRPDFPSGYFQGILDPQG